MISSINRSYKRESIMLQTIAVDNLKCGGCANTITKGLQKIVGVKDVSVDVDKGLVSFDGDATLYEEAARKLDDLGYPVRGSASGLHSAVEAAKSYVSCAIGRVAK
jgi:copper chaperone